MIGYRKPGEPLQMARPDLIGLPEAAYLVGALCLFELPSAPSLTFIPCR